MCNVLSTLQEIPYSRRIEQLGLQSLELRSLINDLLCDKIVFGLTVIKMSDYFMFSPVSHQDILINCLFPAQLLTPENTTFAYVLLSHGITKDVLRSTSAH